MAETFSNQAQMVKNTVQTTMISIGTRLEADAAKITGSFGSLLKGIKIGVDTGAFDPLFKYLDDVGASLSTWLDAVAKAFPDALKAIDYSGLVQALKDLGKAFGGLFGDLDLTKAKDLAGALQTLVDIITGFVRITTGMVEAFKPFASQIAEFFKAMASGDEATQRAAGNILLFSKAIKEAGLGVVAAIVAIDELRVSMSGLFEIVSGSVQLAWGTITSLFNGVKSFFLTVEAVIVGMMDRLTFGLLPGLQSWMEVIDKQRAAVLVSINKDLEHMGAGAARLVDGLAKLGTESGTAAEKVRELGTDLKALPEKKTIPIEVQVAEENKKKAEELRAMIAALPDTKTVGIKVAADGSSVEQAWGMVISKIPGQVTTIVQAKTATGTVDAATKKLDEIPKDKTVEVKLEEARLKEQSAVIQAAMEWSAKVNITQAETALKSLETIATSVSTTINSTATLLSDLTATYTRTSSGSSVIYDQIQQESRRRDDALKLQKDLTAAEIANINARTQLLKNGEALIKVEAKGLQPQLEAFMFEILKSIQVRATSEGANFLLGMTTGTAGT